MPQPGVPLASDANVGSFDSPANPPDTAAAVLATDDVVDAVELFVGVNENDGNAVPLVVLATDDAAAAVDTAVVAAELFVGVNENDGNAVLLVVLATDDAAAAVDTAVAAAELFVGVNENDGNAAPLVVLATDNAAALTATPPALATGTTGAALVVTTEDKTEVEEAAVAAAVATAVVATAVAATALAGDAVDAVTPTVAAAETGLAPPADPNLNADASPAAAVLSFAATSASFPGCVSPHATHFKSPAALSTRHPLHRQDPAAFVCPHSPVGLAAGAATVVVAATATPSLLPAVRKVFTVGSFSGCLSFAQPGQPGHPGPFS